MFVFGSSSLAVKPAPISSVDTYGWHSEKKKLADEKILPALKAAQEYLKDAKIDSETRKQLLSLLVPDLLQNASSLQKSLQLSGHRDEKAFAGAITQLNSLAQKINNGDWSEVGSAIKAVEQAGTRLSELSKPQAEAKKERTSLSDVTPKMMKPIDVLKLRGLVHSLNEGSGTDFNFKGAHKTAEQENTTCEEAVDLAVELKMLTPGERYKIMELGVDPIKDPVQKSNIIALITAVFGVGKGHAREMFRIAKGLLPNDVNVAICDPTQHDARLGEQGVSAVVEALDKAIGLTDGEYRLWKWAMKTVGSGKDIARERLPKFSGAKAEKEEKQPKAENKEDRLSGLEIPVEKRAIKPAQAAKKPEAAEKKEPEQKKEQPKPAPRISREPFDFARTGPDSPVFASKGEAFEGPTVPKVTPPWGKKHFVPEKKEEKPVAKVERKEPESEGQKAPKLEAMQPKSRDYSASRKKQEPSELAYVKAQELKRTDIAEVQGKIAQMEEKQPKAENKEDRLSGLEIPVERRAAIKPAQKTTVQEAKKPEAKKEAVKEEKEAAKKEAKVEKKGKAEASASKNVFEPYKAEAGHIKWLMALGENKPENEGVRKAFNSMDADQKAAFVELIREKVDAGLFGEMNASTLERRINIFRE